MNRRSVEGGVGDGEGVGEGEGGGGRRGAALTAFLATLERDLLHGDG